MHAGTFLQIGGLCGRVNEGMIPRWTLEWQSCEDGSWMCWYNWELLCNGAELWILPEMVILARSYFTCFPPEVSISAYMMGASRNY